MRLEIIKNYLLIIKESWLDNINLLISPENLSKLFLVSLRAAYQSFKSLYIYLIIYFALIFFMPFSNLKQELFGNIIDLSLFLLLILSLRASVGLKNQKYYISHLDYFIPAIGVCLVYYFVDRNFDIKLFVFPVVWMLFILDSKLTVFNFFMSLYRSLLMLILNIPIFLLIRFILFGLINLLKLSKLPIKYFLPNLPSWTSLIFYIILYLIITFFAALVSKIYIKQVHEKFNLYF